MRGLVLAAILVGWGVPAMAEDVRYRLERAGDAFVRMDTQTGAMSVCELSEGDLKCRPASEAGAPADAALTARVAALEGRVEALEKAPAPAAGLPTDEEFERTLGFMERFMRRFIGIAREFEDEPAPDRT